MRKQHRNLLVGIAIAALCVTAAVDWLLYRQYESGKKAQLLLAARAQARLIDLSGALQGLPSAGGMESAAFSTNLQQLHAAYQPLPILGRTGEFVFGQVREGKLQLVCLGGPNPSTRHTAIALESAFAAPMEAALTGASGVLHVYDYRNVRVLAAYAPVRSLGLAVVAKMDLAEIYRPFLYGGLLSGVLVVLCVLLGALPILRSLAPLERRLEESEEYNRMLVAGAAEAILSMDQAGIVRSMNPAGERMFGYDLAEAVDRPLAVLIPGADAQSLALQHDRDVPAVRTGRRKDGSAFLLELAIGASTAGGAPYSTGIVRDVTHGTAAREALEASRRLLQTVVDSIPVAVYLKDRQGRYVLVNRTMAEHHRMKAEQMIGLRVSDLPYRSAEEYRLIESTERRVLDSGLSVDLPEVRVHLADGDMLWQRQIRAPYFDEDGNVVGVVGMAMDITQRKRAQDELRESQRLLQTVFDAIPHTLVIKDREARYRMVNRTWLEFHGHTLEEVLGMDGRQLPRRTPEERNDIWEADQAVLSGRVAEFAIENHRTARDGSQRVMQNIRVSLRGEHGEITGLVALALDVTERHRSAEALRASERLLQTVFDTFPFSLTVKDLDSRYLMVNRGWLETFGYTTEEALHRQAFELEHRSPEERAQVMANDRTVIEGDGALVVVDVERTTFAGELRRYRNYKAGFRDDQGRLAGIVTLSLDIDEAHRKEQALRESQRLLQTVYDTMPSLLVIKDPVGRYLMVNRAWSDFFGVTSEQAWGKYAKELPYRSASESLETERMDLDVLDGQHEQSIVELVRKRVDGRDRYLQSFRVPLHDESDAITGMIVLAADITERREAEAALRTTMRNVALVQRVAVAANSADTPEEALRATLREVCQTLAWSAGHFLATEGSASERLLATGWSFPDPLPAAAGEALRALAVPERTEASRQALRTRRPVWLAPLPCADEARGAETGAVPGTALCACCVVPVLAGHEGVGVLEFFSECGELEPPALLEALSQIGAQIGHVVERHRAAAELTASEERYRHLIEGSLQGLLILHDERAVFANQAYADLLGYRSPEDVLKHWTFEVTFPSHQLGPVLETYHARLRGEPAPSRMELEYQKLDGTCIWAEVNVRLIVWDGLQATQVTVHEITERRLAEAALRASEERFRNLIEGSHQGIAIHAKGVPLFANDAFARIYGYDSPEEVLALGKLEALVESESIPLLREHQHRALSSERAADSLVTMAGRTRDGRPIHVEALFQAIEWQGRSAVQITLADISDRVHLEEQLRQAQKMEAVGQLAGGVAHDFNNILQIIRGYSELAREVVAGSSAEGYLDKVLKATHSASQVVRHLLALSRREVLRPTEVDVNRLIGDVMQMVRRVIGETIELTVQADADPAIVRADATMLEQVLLNLCVNARDAMPDGGRLTIRTARLHPDDEAARRLGLSEAVPYVRISVEDTGVGISSDAREHVFEPFFTTKEAGKGTGLGLSMAYGIVRQHDGLMELRSEPGEGATFHIYLPGVGGAEAETQPWSKDEAPSGTETVLVAEDEDAVLRLVVQLLESQGYRVLMAADGEEAVRIFHAHADEIDLAMLDVVMPRKSGRAVYDVLQASRPDLPILFSTGYSADALDPDFVRAHTFHLIRKPYSPAALFHAIRQALDSPWPPPFESRGGSAPRLDGKSSA